MCSITENPATTDNPQPQPAQAEKVNHLRASPRRRKETLLPQIMQLALDGHSGESIAQKRGLPKRTVNHWRQKVRQKWTADVAEGTGADDGHRAGPPRFNLSRGDGPQDLDLPSPYGAQVHRGRLLAAINALPLIEDLPEDEESSPPDPLPKEET